MNEYFNHSLRNARMHLENRKKSSEVRVTEDLTNVTVVIRKAFNPQKEIILSAELENADGVANEKLEEIRKAVRKYIKPSTLK
jgi:hypothetical protein